MHLIFNRFAITGMRLKTYFQINKKNSLFHNITDFTLFLSNKSALVSKRDF